MHVAVRSQPEVTRREPAAGLVAACDLDPLRKRLLREVGRPGVEQPAEIVVPLLPGQFALELTPRLVRLDDVADAKEMHSPAAQRHVGITDPNGFGLVIFRPPRPLEPTLRAPFAGAVTERPFGMVVADVLEKNKF